MNRSKIMKEVSAVSPIYGLRFVDENDKNTWSIDFRDEATPEQRAAAQAVLVAYVDEPEPAELDAEDVLAILVAEGVVSKARVDQERDSKKLPQ